jgi:hypothetical protein
VLIFVVLLTHYKREMKLVWAKEKEHSSTGLLGEPFDVPSMLVCPIDYSVSLLDG